MADERPVWQPDPDAMACNSCQKEFWLFFRRHHCRNCGKIFCWTCSQYRLRIPKFGFADPVRVCLNCYRDSNQPKRRKESLLKSEKPDFESNQEANVFTNNPPASNEKTSEADLALGFNASDISFESSNLAQLSSNRISFSSLENLQKLDSLLLDAASHRDNTLEEAEAVEVLLASAKE
eukprot:TRINITY_DN5981_c0_g1_i1.p1 TRINITY_DN5981_c0_g1~~TRINITY_DN5981_c0_g1_i1.p1  ORF type:complete len:179 (-),score=24.92 TRINITY_DN5981_c0_g1_i1:69-605(-)